MIKAGSSEHLRPHCFSVYSLISFQRYLFQLELGLVLLDSVALFLSGLQQLLTSARLFCKSFFWSQYPPHLIKGIHIERKIKQLSLIVGNGTIRISIKFYNGIDKIPNLFVGCMEYMGTIFMDIDTFNIITVYVSTQLWTFVYYQTFFPACFARQAKQVENNPAPTSK